MAREFLRIVIGGVTDLIHLEFDTLIAVFFVNFVENVALSNQRSSLSKFSQ